MSPYLSTWPKVLVFGDTGPAVQWVQERLAEQGFFKGVPRGNYLSLTRNAVFYFQSTHLGPDGAPLAVDGETGKDTRWSLANPSGAAQRSRLGDDIIPAGLTDRRLKFLQTVAADYRSGDFIEVPDGSNTGPRIGKFSRGTFWCAFYQSDAWKRTFGDYPMGKDHGHCLTFWREASKAGLAHPKEKAAPLPGDFGIMLYRNQSGGLTGSGHIFAVTRVSGTGRQINSIGGNEGNRLKHGLRNVSDPTIAGWISLYGDSRDSVAFDRGIITAPSAATSSTATR